MVASKSPSTVAPAKSAKRPPAKSAAPARKKAVAGPVARKAAAKPLAKAAAAAPVARKTATAPVPAKPKHKLVRDSFTIPKSEYAVLQDMKARANGLKRPAKKSELLRAGIALLAALGDSAFLAALAKIPSLKTGRPKDPAVSA
jgi:hypothetical protein